MDIGVTAVMLPEIDFEEQVDLCVSLGVRLYQIRPRKITPEQRTEPYSCWGNHRFDLTPERLVREGAAIEARLRQAGMSPWGPLPSPSAAPSDDEIDLHLRGAQVAKAGCMRLSAPPYPSGIFDFHSWMDGVVERYKHIIKRLARRRGIKIIIETHAKSGVTSPGLAWQLVRHFDPRELGVIFDIGNFAREGEVNAELAVSVLKEWIDCVHVGGSRRREEGVDSNGCRTLSQNMCAPQDSDLHVPTWIAALRAAEINPPLIIEDFTATPSGPERLRRDARFLNGLLGLSAGAQPQKRS
jgi:sugar phosphate isomerase/epimerase